MAAEEVHKDIVECLVDNGTDINIKNNDGVKCITFYYMQLITTPGFISFQVSPTQALVDYTYISTHYSILSLNFTYQCTHYSQLC